MAAVISGCGTPVGPKNTKRRRPVPTGFSELRLVSVYSTTLTLPFATFRLVRWPYVDDGVSGGHQTHPSGTGLPSRRVQMAVHLPPAFILSVK